MRVLVVNAGSSSLKLRMLEGDEVAGSRDLSIPGAHLEQDAVARAVEGLGGADAVGHRIVHGGTAFSHAVMIDEGVRRQLNALVDLAPLHQPKSLAALDAVSAVLPDTTPVGCFDTAFHASMPDAASTYALPPYWRRHWRLRRYGFHGLSHAYVSRRAADFLGHDPVGLRVVTCHLGAGASLAAVQDGRSVDTTMGFTPLEGLVMATRSGTVDPGLVLWLEEHAGTPPAELAATLEHRSGLLGLAGTADMREVLARSAAGDPAATLALEVYIHRLRAGIASMAAAMNGLDVLVFTGGVGEHAPEVRARAVEGVRFLGASLDRAANEAAKGDSDIGAADASVHTLLIEAREDLEMARQVRDLLGAQPQRA